LFSLEFVDLHITFTPKLSQSIWTTFDVEFLDVIHIDVLQHILIWIALMVHISEFWRKQ